MFLIGQYDSPFVRRVAIAMRLYGVAFEHKPWSTFGDADRIAPYNPLRRVPTLVLDDGEALIESAIILDYLDEEVVEARAMIARSSSRQMRGRGCRWMCRRTARRLSLSCSATSTRCRSRAATRN